MRKMAFLQANWYKAEQYCRFHGMHLASINSEEEQRELEVGLVTTKTELTKEVLNWEAWTRPIPNYNFNSNGHTQYLPFSGAHHGLRDGERALLEQRHGPGRGGQVSHCRWVPP